MKKIERLIYTNENGEIIEFSHTSKFHTNEVSGISDVRNSIYSNNSMGQDGDTFLGQRIESRAIELVGSINERNRDRVRQLKREMNRILNPQFDATLTYEYGEFRRLIDCKVDNAPVFTRGVIFQDFTVQLTCLNPFWRKEVPTRDDIAVWVGAFEFPEPEGLEIVPGDTGWEVGFRQPSLIVNVFNDGDVKTGLKVEFRALGMTSNPVLLNIDTQEFIKINLDMVAGDVLTVNTGYGQKDVRLYHAGITTDAFRYLDPDSTYLQLAAGDNLFRYDADTSLENLEVSIFHDDLFLGV